jgi:hypothetical protein
MVVRIALKSSVGVRAIPTNVVAVAGFQSRYRNPPWLSSRDVAPDREWPEEARRLASGSIDVYRQFTKFYNDLDARLAAPRRAIAIGS